MAQEAGFVDLVSSSFVEIAKYLTDLHQAKYQAFLDLCTEQKYCLEVLVMAQASVELFECVTVAWARPRFKYAVTSSH